MENSFFLFKRIEFVHSVLHTYRTLFKKLASISKKNNPSIPNLTYTLDLRYIILIPIVENLIILHLANLIDSSI